MSGPEKKMSIQHDYVPGVRLEVDLDRLADAVPPIRVLRAALGVIPKLEELERELRRWWRRSAS